MEDDEDLSEEEDDSDDEELDDEEDDEDDEDDDDDEEVFRICFPCLNLFSNLLAPAPKQNNISTSISCYTG